MEHKILSIQMKTEKEKRGNKYRWDKQKENSEMIDLNLHISVKFIFAARPPQT